MYKSEFNSVDLEVLVKGQDTVKMKILGLQWDESNGTFIFDVKDIIKPIFMRLTDKFSTQKDLLIGFFVKVFISASMLV